jgi:MFS family permease
MQEVSLNEEAYSQKSYSLLTPWFIWLTSALFVLFQFFLQLSSGVMIDELMHSFSINALGAGLLASTYYYVYVALQTPAGMLIDYYGPRKLLTLGGFICAVGCWLFASATHLLLAELGRLLMGAGCSFAFVGSLYLISRWFSTSKFALMVGIAETAGTVGTIVGNLFLATAMGQFGWRHCMLGAAFGAVMISIACWLIIRDRPALSTKEVSRIKPDKFFQQAVAIIKNPVAWWNGLYSGLLFSVVTVFVALWGIPFLMKAQHISITLATLVASFVFVGLAIGCPLIGFICQRLANRQKLMSACAFACATLLTVVLLTPNLSLIITCLLLFLIGVLCSSYVINFAIAKEIASEQATSTSIGFTNTLSVITAPLMQPIVGGLLQFVHYLSGNTGKGIESYTLGDFQLALLILPLGLIFAGIIAFYACPSRRRN